MPPTSTASSAATVDLHTSVLLGRMLNGACWGVVIKLFGPGLDPASIANRTATLVATL